MNKVMIYGPVAEKYGSEFMLAVRDPIEAVRAMHVQLPGFLQMCEEHNYVAVREFGNGKFALTPEMMFLGMNNGTIHLLPNVDGANNTKGVAKTVIGIALVVGSFFIPGGQILGIAYSTLALTVGMALAFSGLAMLIAPTPTFNKGDKQAKDESFLYNGDTNPADQGIPVPVTYGIDRVVPIPIATKITTNQITVGSATDGSSTFGSGSTSTGTDTSTGGTGVGSGVSSGGTQTRQYLA